MPTIIGLAGLAVAEIVVYAIWNKLIKPSKKTPRERRDSLAVGMITCLIAYMLIAAILF